MPRGATYSDSEERALSGARTLDRDRSDAANLDQRNLAAQREARMAESQALNDEVQRWEFEKAKTLDRNAAAMKIETNKQAIAANEELFKINTGDPEADLKLADWGAKYFRVLDEKTGDPRLIRQFQINQQRVENRKLLTDRATEVKTLRDERLAEAAASKAEQRAYDESQKAPDDARALKLYADKEALKTKTDLPAGVATQYSKALGEISGNQSLEQSVTGPKLEEVKARRFKNEEIVRSLESQHPELRATRGLEVTAAKAAAPAYAPGATAVKNGITYVRGDDGKWLPQP